MFENITALDIGTASIKLLTVKTGIRNFQVVSLVYEDVDQSPEDRVAAVSEALKKVLEENDLKGHIILTNLPMEKTLIRNISFPFSDVNKIAEAIPFEAEENIPFRSEDIVLDFLSLKSREAGTGRVMLAAAPREAVKEFLSIVQKQGVTPSRFGLESHALFECYKYFNRLPDENVIQLDIGSEKTILNIISSNHLLYSRCIPVGISGVHRKIAEYLRIPMHNACTLFRRLDLDLTGLENNYHREVYKTLDLSRPRLKKIFESANEVFDEIASQMILSLKSFAVEYGELDINRILLSGGGANIQGIGMIFARETDLPVVSLPFLEGYKEQRIQTQFPIVFGTMISHVDRNRGVNFLKGEFVPDMVNETRKIYYLSSFFMILALIVFIIYLGISSIIKLHNSKKYRQILNERLKQYFLVREQVKDPIGTAVKMINEEKKEIASLDAILQPGDRIIDILKLFLTYFPRDDGFQLKNMVINENVIRIDGMISSSAKIDEFKNKLQESRQFESVNLNTTLNKKNEVNFSMVVKKKTVKPTEGKPE